MSAPTGRSPTFGPICALTVKAFAMPEGGRLTIETSNAHLGEADVGALPEPVAGVLISVSDTG